MHNPDSTDRGSIEPASLREDVRAAILSAYDSAAAPAGAAGVSSVQAAEIQRRFDSLLRTAAAIGQQPPQPPSLRARVSGVFVRLIRKTLFWYSQQIICAQTKIAVEFASQAEAIAILQQKVERLEAEVAFLRANSPE